MYFDDVAHQIIVYPRIIFDSRVDKVTEIDFLKIADTSIEV